jgi:hypothetical protein
VHASLLTFYHFFKRWQSRVQRPEGFCSKDMKTFFGSVKKAKKDKSKKR